MQLHSNSVQEIISRPPAFLIKVGVYIVVCSFMILIFISFFISVPRVVTEHIIISAQVSGEKKLIEDHQLFEGKVSVPSVEYGLVQVGQTVNIKLHAYPYLEFGILQGIVSQVSSNPVEADGNLFYNVSITLPNMLTTTNGIKIPFAYKLEGIAEIEVKQRMLSDIIFEPFVMLSQKTH